MSATLGHYLTAILGVYASRLSLESTAAVVPNGPAAKKRAEVQDPVNETKNVRLATPYTTPPHVHHLFTQRIRLDQDHIDLGTTCPLRHSSVDHRDESKAFPCPAHTQIVKTGAIRSEVVALSTPASTETLAVPGGGLPRSAKDGRRGQVGARAVRSRASWPMRPQAAAVRRRISFSSHMSSQ